MLCLEEGLHETHSVNDYSQRPAQINVDHNDNDDDDDDGGDDQHHIHNVHHDQ